jgi:hypothetical protein
MFKQPTRIFDMDWSKFDRGVRAGFKSVHGQDDPPSIPWAAGLLRR